MPKTKQVSSAELPTASELRQEISNREQKRADKAAKNLVKLTSALDRSTARHTTRLAQTLSAAARSDQFEARYAVREFFPYTSELNCRDTHAFALDCVAYVAGQLAETLAPDFTRVETFGGHFANPTGANESAMGIAVESAVFVSWIPAE